MCVCVHELTATITVIGIHYLDENLNDRDREIAKTENVKKSDRVSECR